MKSEYIIVLFLKGTNLPLEKSVSGKLLSVQLVCNYWREPLSKGPCVIIMLFQDKRHIFSQG